MAFYQLFAKVGRSGLGPVEMTAGANGAFLLLEEEFSPSKLISVIASKKKPHARSAFPGC
jgi:hypothetical protein